MGRFFQAQEVELSKDHIYQPPVELMAKVIQNADTQIQTNETALLSLYDKLQAEGLKVDEPRLQEIIKGYQSNIDNMAAELQQDPLGFRKRMASIKQLGRDISNDWSQGEVAKIQGNKQTRDNYQKLLDERVKQGKIMQEDANKALQLFDSKYTGIGYEGPNKYNSYQTENLNDYINAMDVADKIGKGWEADLKAKGYQYEDGQWVRSVNGSTEKVDFNEVKTAVEKGLLADKELMGYYEQQVKLGFMTPQDVSKKLSDVTNVVANKYSYTKTKEETGMDANSNYWKQLEWNKAIQDEEMLKVLETNIETGEIYGNTIAQEQAAEKWLLDLGKGLNNSVTGKPYKFNDLDQAIRVLQKSYDKALQTKSNKNTLVKLKDKLNTAINYKEQLLSASKATWSPLYDKGFSVTAVDKLKEKTNEDFKANGMSYKFRLPKLQIIDEKGNTYNSTLKDKYQEFTPKNLINKKVLTPYGTWVKIKNVNLIEKSVKPIFINGVINDKNINNNDAHSMLKIVYDEDGVEKSFNQPAYFNMQQNQGFSFNF